VQGPNSDFGYHDLLINDTSFIGLASFAKIRQKLNTKSSYF